jgi:sugar phosphate isomerase/epimerase
MEAAFSRVGAAELPVVICYESVFIRDHWAQLTSCPWWYQQSPDVGHQERWMREVASHIGQDWVQLFPFCTAEERADLPIEERADGVYRINPATGEACKLTPPQVSGWRAEEQVESVHTEQLPESFDEVDRLLVRRYGEGILGDQGGGHNPTALTPSPRPSGERGGVKGTESGTPIALLSPALSSLGGGEGGTSCQHQVAAIGGATRELASQVVKIVGRELYPCRHISGPFWNTYGLWGFEGMMMLAGTRPDLVKHACDRILARTLAEIREYASPGTAGIWIEECLTDVLSPAAFAELNQPYIRRLVEEIRGCGMNSIYYFTGNPAGKWDLLLSVGADALSFEESKKNFRVDIEEVAERLAGKCALLGNLDAMNLLQNGSESELRDELKRQIQAGRKNKSRFIMSLGSPVTPETPVEWVRLYCDLAHEFGAI